jgi:hypothetical protein
VIPKSLIIVKGKGKLGAEEVEKSEGSQAREH